MSRVVKVARVVCWWDLLTQRAKYIRTCQVILSVLGEGEAGIQGLLSCLGLYSVTKKVSVGVWSTQFGVRQTWLWVLALLLSCVLCAPARPFPVSLTCVVE